ncbi:MAG: hypothetical protein JXM70_06765 [Pirellulales bacterium]|nr:hypothetical protein [Pirellulales bacterium]
MNISTKRRPLQCILAGLVLFGCLGAVGCQSDISGQTLPSPWYITDDVQYFAPGPEFKLAKEAAAMKAQAAEDALQNR